MKPKFIFSLGVGWSGTTSLYYTLKNMKYVHTGPLKEIQSLDTYYDKSNKDKELDIYDRFIDLLKVCTRTHEDNNLNKITEKDINYILGPSRSWKKYIQYYLNLYQYVKDDYQAVGDFSNVMLLDEHYFKEVISELSKHFDVKCLLSLRDPVRRAWAHAGAYCNLDETRYFYKFSKVNSLHPCISDNIFDSFEAASSGKNYVKIINTYYNIFGKENVCYLIMEDLYNKSNQKEKNKLENFLNIKIEEMYPCCFVPDRGINAPKDDPFLKDQWDSDHTILTPEIYNKYRNREDFVEYYSTFETFHGSLPADWGSPIDYGY